MTFSIIYLLIVPLNILTLVILLYGVRFLSKKLTPDLLDQHTKEGMKRLLRRDPYSHCITNANFLSNSVFGYNLTTKYHIVRYGLMTITPLLNIILFFWLIICLISSLVIFFTIASQQSEFLKLKWYQ